MSKQRVFLVGATGETGQAVLDAFIKDGTFVSSSPPSPSSTPRYQQTFQEITCFIRTSSATKPSTLRLRDLGITLAIGDLNGPISDLVTLLQDTSILISCLPIEALPSQITLINAAAKVSTITRFIPSNWATPAARGGIIASRDIKEDVHDYLFRLKLPFTIIDVGFWFQASVPLVSGGKLGGWQFGPNDVYCGGDVPNTFIDQRDIGRITVEIVKDERTVNRRVMAYGEVLTQNQLQRVVEERTGEKLEVTHVIKTGFPKCYRYMETDFATQKSADEARATLQAREEEYNADRDDRLKRFHFMMAQYVVSKYVNEDNTPENAKYLGYIDAHELFPDFKYTTFGEFMDDLLADKIRKPYPDRFN
jgi:hypothetical protein